MRQRLTVFLKTYLLLLLIFMVQKPLFMLWYHKLYAGVGVADWFRVVWHGLPLDLSLAGYLTALPGLMLIASVWTDAVWLRRLHRGYFFVIALLLALIFVVDMGLYEFWGFRLDATPLFYFFSSPGDALASVSLWFVLEGLVAIAVVGHLYFWAFRRVLLHPCRLLSGIWPLGRQCLCSLALLLLTGLLFIPIRGGFTVSTMNVGKVYFSQNLRLNHAATNPAFSLMESLGKQKNFAAQYRFLPPEEADRLFEPMLDPEAAAMKRRAGRRGADTLRYSVPEESSDTLRNLFREERPDVLFIVLESFSSHLMTSLGGEPDIAVCLDSLSREAVLFTHFYANSFRTDRGLVSILSGYPAQPTTSLMKYPRKTQRLPSICGTLKRAGYLAKYYYGGDADFTNMRSYLMSSGFDALVSDRDFPVSERLSKWGAHDHLVFDRLLDDLRREAEIGGEEASPVRRPRFRVLQTSSSHEPFQVPYRRLKNDRLNAFAYTDSCVGDFVRHFRELPQWKHTVIVLVPDHLGCYPENIDNLTPERYRIPLMMLGGAVRAPRRIDVYGSQQDIAATLLAQLGLPHGEFLFSKDLMNPDAPHFAFFTVPDAFGMLTPDNRLIYDCQAARTALDEGTAPGKNLLPGQAYLQKLYDDIAAR